VSRPVALVLRALGLGDLLAGVPALRALRRALPGHRIVLATPAELAPLVRLTGAVDAVHPHRGLAPLDDLRAPDLAVNLHGRGPQSHRVLQRLGPRRLVAFGSDDATHPGPRWQEDEHERVRWCRLLREVLGAEADPDDVLLGRPEEPSPAPGAVVVHPGAAFASRRWPAERFAEVARWANEQDHRVVLTGGREERRLATDVQRAAGLSDDAVLAGRTDLATLAAVIADARLVICGDTGTAHLASAYRTPSVLLFGPTPPERWGPPRNGPHRVLWQGTAAADPFADHPDATLLQITPGEVIGAAEEALARTVAG
jgi:ADP-heptose:LPS heptosyltransferase